MMEAIENESEFHGNVSDISLSHFDAGRKFSEKTAVFVDDENIRKGMRKGQGLFNPGSILDYCRMNIGIPTINKLYLKGYYLRPLNLMLCRDNDFEVTVVEDNKKDAADMSLICDAMETIFVNSYVSTYVIVSGDKDFMPLIRKLHRHGKRIIVIAHRHCTSPKFIKGIEKLGHQFLDYSIIYQGA
ncbi:MAG: NYN domain-containing protein [Nitrospirae bacterium]|nr:NYN domain-containing protein [Nitrospirota bacterium]